MNIRLKRKYSIVSNALFMIPLVIAYTKELWTAVLLLSLVIIFSVFYHYAYRGRIESWKEFYTGGTLLHLVSVWLDISIPVVFACYLFVLLQNQSFPVHSWLVLVVGLVGLGFLYYPAKNKVDKYHATWHACAALAITIALLFT